jgi:hypothetical protein
MNKKIPCSLTDQRKGQLKRRFTAGREILSWKICADIARKSGLSTYKLTDYKQVDSMAERGGFEPPIELLTL